MDKELENLLSLLQDAQTQHNDSGNNLYITSVREAESMIGRSLSLGKTREVKDIVDYITNPDNNVTGSSDQYHNLMSSLLRFGNYPATLQVCDYALQKYPYSIDILANAINSSGKSGNFDKGLKYLTTAEEISKEHWNWRLFVFSIDFYQEYLKTCPRNQVEHIWQTAMDLAKDFQRNIPMDERSYNAQAELYLFKHDYKNARTTLRNVIFDVHRFDTLGTPSRLVPAQCCVTYLTNILDDSQDYDEIIVVADKGLQFTAQEQPSARIGYFVYRKALAMDAKCIASAYNSEDNIRNTLRQYQCAYPLNKDMSYGHTIQQRFNILCKNPVNPIHDMSLDTSKQNNSSIFDDD